MTSNFLLGYPTFQWTDSTSFIALHNPTPALMNSLNSCLLMVYPLTKQFLKGVHPVDKEMAPLRSHFGSANFFSVCNTVNSHLFEPSLPYSFLRAMAGQWARILYWSPQHPKPILAVHDCHRSRALELAHLNTIL